MSGTGVDGPWVNWPMDHAPIAKPLSDSSVSLPNTKGGGETAQPGINSVSLRRGEENKSLTEIYKYSLG